MPRLRQPYLPCLGAVLLACAVSHVAAAATLEVGPDRTFKLPSEAMAAAHDGDTVRIAAGEYFDCATVPQNRLTIEGTGPDASAILTDKACGGKGLLITTGNDITVRNLTLARARVPDNNAAGIRSEGVNLLVEGVKFINDQDGILANPTPEGSIIVRDSEFTRNGVCAGGCAHGIYVSALKLLRIEHSKFSETKQAHHIKSRAARTEVIGCEISDGPNGTASYEIDVPNGGALVVRDNIIVKGPKSENHTAMIMIGEEGVTQRTSEITVENNTARNDGSHSTFLVDNQTATEAVLKGNKLSGPIQPLLGDGNVE